MDYLLCVCGIFIVSWDILSSVDMSFAVVVQWKLDHKEVFGSVSCTEV